ncbi:L-2-hydroxyglutarate dehydrogenase, mitochondrial [Tanacetum coccineum]
MMKVKKLMSNSIKKFSSIAAGGVDKESVDCVVIGAGVVGIAIARELSLNYGRNVFVIESASTFGTATSSRNSQVIHAGIYYPNHSLKMFGNVVEKGGFSMVAVRFHGKNMSLANKGDRIHARFCVRGKRLLYEYCKEHGIPHKQIGKLIVASRYEEVPNLHYLLKRGIENGVDGLKMMDGSEAMSLEPELQCVRALWSPTSGIIDSHSLMLSQMLVVNSAGLSAAALARCFSGINYGVIPRSHYARGCYFSLTNTTAPPFTHLIYPIPEDGGLGVHVTLDLDGQVKFGPDVEWLNEIDAISSIQNKFEYTVCADRAKKFYPEIRKYYPSLENESLQPAYAGIRPKLSGLGEGFVDFII